jgi:hypothetical protein
MEWSDNRISLHENIPGSAKDTERGWVQPVFALGKDKPDWIYRSTDGKVQGSTETRQEAMDALKQGLNATEIDGHNYSSNPWHK